MKYSLLFYNSVLFILLRSLLLFNNFFRSLLKIWSNLNENYIFKETFFKVAERAKFIHYLFNNAFEQFVQSKSVAKSILYAIKCY